MKHHLIYSYRRCPYAMRARMALVQAQIQCEVYEIDFKDKPAHMLEISPKGTVPVLSIVEGQVIDESLDIMYWALKQNDPDCWLDCDVSNLIAENDGVFKRALDRYKYPNRFPDEDCSKAREQGGAFLLKLNERLQNHKQLMAEKITIADIAIFPFVRQFANIDRAWFDALDIKPLQQWLATHLESELFKQIFQKRKETPYLLLG
jgi:glutathione S-transferase